MKPRTIIVATVVVATLITHSHPFIVLPGVISFLVANAKIQRVKEEARKCKMALDDEQVAQEMSFSDYTRCLKLAQSQEY